MGRMSEGFREESGACEGTGEPTRVGQNGGGDSPEEVHGAGGGEEIGGDTEGDFRFFPIVFEQRLSNDSNARRFEA